MITGSVWATILTATALASCALVAQPVLAKSAPDILTSPADDVALTLSEGTWLSVDVSPDGKTIIFDLLNDIYSMPAGGGEAKAILSGPATQRSPQFSPDGRKILYLSDETGADNIWIADPDGRNPQQVTRENLAMITGPAWVPDGRAVVAIKRSAANHEMRTSELRYFEIGGAVERQLVEPPKSGKDMQEPRYSPDGRYLYYTERVAGTHYVYNNTALSNFVVRRRDMLCSSALTAFQKHATRGKVG